MAQPDKQDFETEKQFKARQDLFAAQQRAALGFEQRQQALAGLAPQVAPQDRLQTEAQTLAEQGVGSFAPFLGRAETQAASSCRSRNTGSWTIRNSGTNIKWCTIRSTAFQQDVSHIYVSITKHKLLTLR